MAAKVEIIYVTFSRDFDFLQYSMRSFQKYCKGFFGVKIVVPTDDTDRFLPFEGYSTKECPVRIKNFLEYPQKGFVHHLAMQCCADIFCPDAEYILHMDPDCLWCKPTTPSDYFVGGKPVLVVEPYEILKTVHPNRFHWKSVTEEALPFACDYETMCRHPAVHNRLTYGQTRHEVESKHNVPFIDFVLKQKNKFPQGFGEFNTLGAVAIKRFSDKYHLIDRQDKGEQNDPEPHLKQFWSYRLGDGIYDKEIREILK